MGDCLQFFKNALVGGTTTNALEAEQNHDRPKPLPAKRTRCASIFLRGCETDDEHKFRKKLLIDLLRPLHGHEGLEACGLEYRSVTIGEDGKLVEDATNHEAESSIHNYHIEEKKEENLLFRLSERERFTMSTRRNQKPPPLIKHMRMTRLFHTESNTMITIDNRKEFIADGAMYDIVCRLAMEYSQDIMARDGELEWVTIEEATDEKQPIRALVSRRILQDESRLDKEPTLLVVTGKGHVKAGVFSRQHLLVTGLECGSAVQFVDEARERNINVMVLDPNAHGDRCAMKTFEKSFEKLFNRWETAETMEAQVRKNLYVLSHSQSGAQFVRYLLNKADAYLPRIGAIAFTDSTHNIQWAKRQNIVGLEELLEADKTVYFKRTDGIVEHVLKPFKTIGKPVDTDVFWEHRFGKIKTKCAGTSEHSLTNWFARDHIWEHFDLYLSAAEDAP